MKYFNFLLFTLVLTTQLFGQVVEIKFRSPAISTQSKLIRIQDVATLTGGDPAIRQKLAGLELDELSSPNATLDLSADRVRLRALLAGISDKKFKVLPGSTTVRQVDAAILQTRVEQAILAQAAVTYGCGEDSVEIELVTPLESIVSQASLDANSLSATAKLPADLPTGVRTCELTIFDAFGNRTNAKAQIKFTIFRDLARVREFVPRGAVLTEEMVVKSRHPVENSQVAFVSYEQAVGKVAQSDIAQYSLVKSQSVGGKSNQTLPVVVKRNSLMRLTVQKGSLSVTIKNARADQDGRVGDVISFTNLDSKRVIRAKIVDEMTAIVEM
ncbi:MAG: flagella basal body P-ring formation protein FlgA [Pirellulaceae bacterium]